MKHDDRDKATVFHTARMHLEAAQDAVRRAPADDATLELLLQLTDELPGSVTVQRLLIATHLHRGELREAEKAVTEALLLRPGHRVLARLQATCHILMGDWAAALAELHDRLERVPWDSAAHELAGEAAAASDDHELAAGHFAMAAAHSIGRARRRWLIARAHLEAGKLDDAATWLADVGRPCPRLTGLLAVQRGQWVDAADHLARAAADSARDVLNRQLCLRELIAVRQRLATPGPLRAVIEQTTVAQPLAFGSAAAALLGQGEFRQAAGMALRLLRRSRRHVLAWHVLIVAAALDGRAALARRSLGRSSRHGVRIEPALMAGLWRTGLLSSLALLQRDARRCGADPDTRMLTPLLRKAAGVFERRLRAEHQRRNPGGPTVSEPRRRRMLEHRSACLAALGEPVAALYGLEPARAVSPLTRAAA